MQKNVFTITKICYNGIVIKERMKGNTYEIITQT